MTPPTTMTHAEIAALAKGLSRNVRATINDGDEREWYASTERAADQLETTGLVRRPFSHDRRICVPNALGLAVREYLLGGIN